MIHFWYSISISITDTFRVHQYHKSLIHDCDTFTTDVKNDSCCELFIHSVRNCESNSDNAAYSYKLWSWRLFLWLRHNTINWRSNQCCRQGMYQLLEWHWNWKYWQDTVEFGKFSASSSQLYHRLRQLIDCSERLDRSIIEVPRRNNLSDSMFEKLSLLKANHSLFLNWRLLLTLLFLCFYLMALILPSTFDANCIRGCLYYCACIFVLLCL